MTSAAIEEILGRLARSQHGVATRAQMEAEGIGPDLLDHRVHAGRLLRLHRGVYLLGPVPPPSAPVMAACLACGEGAVVSHRSAAALWEIMKPAGGGAPVEITVRGGGRSHVGIRVYRARTLEPCDRTRLHGIPVTTVPRTLLDLAGRVTSRALERAIAETLARRLATLEELSHATVPRRGVAGVGRLRAILRGGTPALTRSHAEEVFLALVRKARLDHPEVNAVLGGHEVDFHWPGAGVVVEVDGFAFHASPRSFEQDRRRDADLAGRGLRVLRITWRQLTEEPEAVLVRLGAALAAPRPER